jgi:SAM-dependent methyltransferase
MTADALEPDVWSEWLLHRRHGDDPAYTRVVQTAVEGYADRVLDGAQLAPGMTLVDVVVTRAVLAYVTEKKTALGEFFRILKPGGRISIAEPILQDEAFYARALRRRVEDLSLPADRFFTLLHRWKSAQFPDTEEACAQSPLVNFERMVRPTAESGKNLTTDRAMYLQAQKPWI